MSIEPVAIHSDRQLFVDDLLIDRLDNLHLKQHEPVRRNRVLTLDKTWEGYTSWCPVVLRTDDRFKMWYRAQGAQEKPGDYGHTFTAYAESDDGVTWRRPNLGLFESNGSTDNNICIDNSNTKNVAIFIDTCPGVPDSERYKAVGRWSSGSPSRIYGLASPDGIHWQDAHDGPLIVATEADPHFDSPLSAFWDAPNEHYVLYIRGWYPDGPEPRIRAIRMTTSEDFIHWTPWQYITIDGNTRYPHHLYTNAGHPYEHAPFYMMFPKRFLPDRTPEGWDHEGLSDILFLASRDGLNYTQPSPEPYLRPGLDPNNWHERSIFIGPRVLTTGPGELSFYSVQNYRTEKNHIRRFTLRQDGFTSLHAATPGTLVTHPFTFEGDRLQINFSTSAAGSIRLALLDASGTPIPGFSITPPIYGDRIDHTVDWDGKADIGALSGRPIRMQCELQEADLYSFQFRKN